MTVELALGVAWLAVGALIVVPWVKDARAERKTRRELAARALARRRGSR